MIIYVPGIMLKSFWDKMTTGRQAKPVQIQSSHKPRAAQIQQNYNLSP